MGLGLGLGLGLGSGLGSGLGFSHHLLPSALAALRRLQPHRRLVLSRRLSRLLRCETRQEARLELRLVCRSLLRRSPLSSCPLDRRRVLRPQRRDGMRPYLLLLVVLEI